MSDLEVCMEETILGLPTQIQEKIVKELDLKSICIVSKVHPIWHDLTNPLGQIWKGFVENMGVPKEKIDPFRESASKSKEKDGSLFSYKDLYLVLLLCRPATMMWITWMNDSYWTMQKSDESMYGEIAHLNSVCWLEITASFRISVPGTYDVIWRLKNQGDINEPQLIVKSKTMGDKSFVLTREIQSYMSGNGWVYMKVARVEIGAKDSKSSLEPQRAKILTADKKPTGKEYDILRGVEDINEEIQVKMFSGTGDWKSGLDIDFIEIVRVD
eukprot:TRINITY_DN3356_c0_g1_i2.p1 TRINITY_DN3356_c0_g1~~TRINITY_DN3356_c0_g1_i2.p1  ORF type:complete len:318 (-),score=70.79 TRINITY_DN3356_c0_g1_i2:36-848(-)